MSLPSDFAVVMLPDDLAVQYGFYRVLIEAVEMHNAAELVGVSCAWDTKGDEYIPKHNAWLHVPRTHRGRFERLFVEARKQSHGPDYHEVRHGWRDAKPASAPLRPSAPVHRKPGGRTW